MDKPSIQISLRLPPSWHDELKELARQAVFRHKQNVSIQDLIKKAIKHSYEELVRYCKG